MSRIAAVVLLMACCGCASWYPEHQEMLDAQKRAAILSERESELRERVRALEELKEFDRATDVNREAEDLKRELEAVLAVEREKRVAIYERKREDWGAATGALFGALMAALGVPTLGAGRRRA